MRKHWYWLGGAALAALTGLAIAQPISSPTLTGNESFNLTVGGPGGSAIFTTVGQMRNATALKLFSGAGAQTYSATNLDSTLFWTGAAPTTWTITTAPAPFDGQILQVGTNTTLTTLVTITPNTGQTMDIAFSAATVTASAAVEWQYSLATTKWYRIH